MYREIIKVDFSDGFSARIEIKGYENEYSEGVGHPMLKTWDSSGHPVDTTHYDVQYSIDPALKDIEALAREHKGITDYEWMDEEYHTSRVEQIRTND